MKIKLFADDIALTSDATGCEEECAYQLVMKLVDDAVLNDAPIFDADAWRALAGLYEPLVEEYFRSRSPLPARHPSATDSGNKAGLEHACHV